MGSVRRVVPFTEPGRHDVPRVGGKNASLGELTSRLAPAGIRVPPGFATTAEAYAELLDQGDLRGVVRTRTDRLHRGAPSTTFAERFDGFSIGSNDLTQLTLGVDRDSEALAHVFDETDPAVVRSIQPLIARAHAAGRSVGLCGQRPSDDPAFTSVLVAAGLDTVPVAPDSFAAVKRHVARAEAKLDRDGPGAAPRPGGPD
ncbi:putative PEP-binding protein [Streptomyces zhihengii]